MNSKGKLKGKVLKGDFEEEKTLIGAKSKWNKDLDYVLDMLKIKF